MSKTTGLYGVSGILLFVALGVLQGFAESFAYAWAVAALLLLMAVGVFLQADGRRTTERWAENLAALEAAWAAFEVIEDDVRFHSGKLVVVSDTLEPVLVDGATRQMVCKDQDGRWFKYRATTERGRLVFQSLTRVSEREAKNLCRHDVPNYLAWFGQTEIAG